MTNVTVAGAITAKQIQDVLASAKTILVVSHIDPDGDALGTALAMAGYLSALNKRVLLIRHDDIPAKYKFLPNVDSIRHVNDIAECEPADAAVVLECPSLSRTGGIDRFIDGNTTIINIDHHQDNDAFGQIDWIDSNTSSVGEMIFEYFEAVGHEIDSDTADQLYTAIMTDTGRFRFASTSPRTLAIAGNLVAAGANPLKISDEVYHSLPLSTIRLLGKVLDKVEYFEEGRICLMTLTWEMLRECNAVSAESDGLIDYTLYGRGVMIGVLLKEFDDQKTRVSFRSRELIDVGAIAARYGGGGHRCASGCTVAANLNKAKNEILKTLREVLDDAS